MRSEEFLNARMQGQQHNITFSYITLDRSARFVASKLTCAKFESILS